MVEDVGELLSKAGLEEFCNNFKQQGFTTGESLMILTMQDYHKFGIVQTEDKRKLFQIIQQQKQSKCKDGKRMSSVIARLTSSERKSKEKKDSNTEPTPPNSTYFNRATFLRRSFNKTKGTDSEAPFTRSAKKSMSSRDRGRCASSQPAFNSKKILSSASAENINNLDNVNRSHHLRKSASGRTDNYNHSKRNESHTNHHVLRSRSKTTSIISSSNDRPSRPNSSKVSDKIKVCVRKRPLNRKERTRNDEDVVDIPGGNQCFVFETKTSVDLSKFVQKHCYTFDRAFSESADNEHVYTNTAKPLVDWIFQGNKSTCFAYGQTGSGKTHTMMGTKSSPGIVTLSARDVFSTIKSQKYGPKFNVFVSFYEIYCGQLFDLINKRKRLNALENAKKTICIVGLVEKQVYSHTDVIDLVNQGGNRRSSGSTSVNAESSRSHAVLQIELKTEANTPKGKFSFIDLAGSERAADVSDTNKQTRMEGAEINTSLLALKECIRALDQEQKHTPFRQSKLTQVLRDSFLGNSKTCMIASISPGTSSCEDTLNTLRYADRVKELGRDSGPPTTEQPPETPRTQTAPPSPRAPPTSSPSPVSSPSPTSPSPDSLSGVNPDNFSLLETSDVASDLPSDVSLVSRTDESDVSNSSLTSNSKTRSSKSRPRRPPNSARRTHNTAKNTPNSAKKPPLGRTPPPRQTTNLRTPSPGTETEPTLTAEPQSSNNIKKKRTRTNAEVSPDVSESRKSNGSRSTDWTLEEDGSPLFERSRTMASAPRARLQISENKMKKAQDDLVASHQIHISQVTNLCSIEAELLQNFADGHLEFAEYLKKLETILETKNKCVESLRAQVACYSLRAAY